MQDYFKFNIPLRTVSESNNTDHWTKKRQRKQQHQIFINSILKSQFDSKNLTFPCCVKLIRIAPRVLDYDNLVTSFKGIRDCVADNLLPGLKAGRADGDLRINWIYDQEKGKPKEYSYRIEIFPCNKFFPS